MEKHAVLYDRRAAGLRRLRGGGQLTEAGGAAYRVSF